MLLWARRGEIVVARRTWGGSVVRCAHRKHARDVATTNALISAGRASAPSPCCAAAVPKAQGVLLASYVMGKFLDRARHAEVPMLSIEFYYEGYKRIIIRWTGTSHITIIMMVPGTSQGTMYTGTMAVTSH